MSTITTYLKDYQPAAFRVEQVELTCDLFDDHAFITNRMTVQRSHPGALHLNGDELELVSIRLNDAPLAEAAYHLEDQTIVITDCPDRCQLTIETRIFPQKNTKLSGLYRSNQLFCTQCEAEGFRRITYYPDRPDVLSRFTTRITADKTKYPILLSNGNLIDKGESADGRHWVIWQDPFKKPSYLFALVAGNLGCVSDTFVTRSGKKIDLRIYVEPGNEDRCTHALNSLKAAMRWDEEQFGREYDLDIFMIVAVSDFNMGAMENKGLNIFNSKYILARPDTATDQDYADIEGVIGHEYFHNWTGNRVTCRDWFQLSLKEGLTVFRDQEFSRDMNSRDLYRIMDVKALRSAQFPEDAGSMAHPVRPDSYQEINNFYTATVYNKGAEVIRMIQTLLGKKGFRKGMDLYFTRHDGQAVTIDDFVAAMADANAVDLTQFKRWYSQAGTPVVKVETRFEEGQLQLTLTQSCPATPDTTTPKEPFHIPIKIGLFTREGNPIPLEKDVLALRESKQLFQFKTGEQPIVSLLRAFSAPIKLEYEPSDEELFSLLTFETDGYAKWNAAQTLAVNAVSRCITNASNAWTIDQPLLAAYRHVLLDEQLDEALRAELLTPPSFEDVIAPLAHVDAIHIEQVRDFYRASTGDYLFSDLTRCYSKLWHQEDHSMEKAAFNRRKLRNTCLWFMMKAKEPEALATCMQQFAMARTMTDQIASLGLLANISDREKRQQAIDQFYHQWAHDDLVLDKWFSIQALSELPGTLSRVETLLSHPAFSLTQPNKVRALIGAFCHFNPRHFHANDGSGYAFLTDMLIKMDPINPQVTARLATPFTRWKKFNTHQQQLMKDQLHRLERTHLSKDLREIVIKSLKE